MTAPDVIGAVGHLTATLEAAGIDYAVSGAIALAYWTAPRATMDIDIALDVGAQEVPALLETLRTAGCVLRSDAAESAQRGDFGARYKGIRIDVFLPLLPLSFDAMQRRVSVPFAQTNIWILSAEDLAVFKLLFGRTKDFADLERLFAAQRLKLDFDYIDRQVAALFETTDERWLRYYELVKLARG